MKNIILIVILKQMYFFKVGQEFIKQCRIPVTESGTGVCIFGTRLNSGSEKKLLRSNH